jgi:hypothetical protein
MVMVIGISIMDSLREEIHCIKIEDHRVSSEKIVIVIMGAQNRLLLLESHRNPINQQLKH